MFGRLVIITIVLALILYTIANRSENFKVMHKQGVPHLPEKVCPPGFYKEGALCFEKCKPGYVAVGDSCRADCPKLYGPDYFNNDTNCRKFTPPSAVKIRPAYERKKSIFEKIKCQEGYQGTLFVGDDRMCHPKCPPGYNAFAGKCWGDRDLKMVLESIMKPGKGQDMLASTNGEIRNFNKCAPGFEQKGDMCIGRCDQWYGDGIKNPPRPEGNSPSGWHNMSGRCYKWWPLDVAVEPKYYRGPGKLENKGGFTVIPNQ